jgi:hypothetical protein
MANGTITSPRTRVEIAEDLGVSHDLLRLARYEADRLRADIDRVLARLRDIERELRASDGGGR